MVIILIICFFLFLIISFVSLNSKMTSIQLVKDMGLGYNFANSFECYSIFEDIKKPEEQITLWGNSIPTKKMIKNLKKYGFKTIRLPITWIHFIDKMGNIDSNWIFYIKQIIDFVVKDYNMYCIINVHNDCKDDNWLSKGINAKNMFIKLWSQISKEFINYDEHLIFESMDNPSYYNSESIYDFETLLILNQAFIDTVRNSGGNNRYRLLLIPSGNSQINYFSFNYRIPNDSYNKFALSTNYFNPYDFCGGNTDNWGSENDYKEMFTEFEILKIFFVDKKIPVIISQAGVMTENNKEKESIREYLYFLFSLSLSLNGMISCLWDTSTSDYKYYDRVNDIWFDEEIKNNFKKISKGKFIKPTDFSFISNIETVTTINSLGHMRIKIGSRKTIRAIFNIKLTTKYPSEVGFGIGGFDKDENWIDIEVSGDEGKKQYDGSYTYDIDISYKGFYNFIELQKWWGNDKIILNTFSIEYDKTYILFDYISYKNAQSNT